ncbi:Histidine phosphatase superfamily, clade-1 [Corchorus olitorius]|uniref:Histidine phosphatase superfamily, clade-1 n=1 Tax=Corchorus olitorius TaxID=93759 RepID=A0A1R3K4Q2_9ROSI|nr:Histidine phosphatase superfamily, clade-1 [Corchorus olitorius]
MSDSNSSCMDGAYAEIVVVRHGETEWNADGRIQGHLDVELNEAGRQQAASVADRLSKEPKISAVYSSDLKRALVTAETIAARCGGLEVIKDPDLRERNLGDLQGLVFREAAKLSPKAYKAFLSHRTEQDIPGGGESLDQLYSRCTSSLQRIASKHKGERVVVVSHGGAIRALYKRACPDGKTGKVLNTSVNVFHLTDDEWTIKSWGDVSHLEQTGSMEQAYTEIIVVRHGETAWNATGRIQGHLDVELNQVGRQQAALIADRLSREPNISAIYSSDLKRALETAETIASSCGKLQVIQDPDLRERHLGDVQGLLFREAAKVRPEAYRAFSSRRTDQVIPGGGESLDQLYHRATISLQRIGQKHRGKRVVVVTHGGVIRALYRRACSKRFRGSIPNTSINIFHLSEADQWTIKAWGDISHLNQTGHSKSGLDVNRTSEV